VQQRIDNGGLVRYCSSAKTTLLDDCNTLITLSYCRRCRLSMLFVVICVLLVFICFTTFPYPAPWKSVMSWAFVNGPFGRCSCPVRERVTKHQPRVLQKAMMDAKNATIPKHQNKPVCLVWALKGEWSSNCKCKDMHIRYSATVNKAIHFVLNKCTTLKARGLFSCAKSKIIRRLER
jgi:hypothetical protein